MGKGKTLTVVMSLFGIVMVILAVLAVVKYLGSGKSVNDVVKEQLIESSLECPDAQTTSVYITIKNLLNDTADETFNVTGYVYKYVGGVESYDTSIGDTTNGLATLDCGTTYRIRFVASNSDAGDNSILKSVIAGSGAKLVDNGKAVEFTPTGSLYTLKLGGEQHGVLQFKSYDVTNDGWMCNSDDTCKDWESEPITFESTTNATALSISATDELNIVLHYRSTNPATSFDDAYYYIMLEGGASAATVWSEPILRLNGQPLTKVTLAGNEAKQFSGYEYVYKVEGQITDDDNELSIAWKPNSGQNPTADVEIDFASAGGFLSTDGSTVLYAAAKDDTSSSVVYTVQDVTLNLS